MMFDTEMFGTNKLMDGFDMFIDVMSNAWPKLVGDSACGGEGGEFSAPLWPFAPFLLSMRTCAYLIIHFRPANEGRDPCSTPDSC
jgi:hypothetical protein